jgi:hypothetical protein
MAVERGEVVVRWVRQGLHGEEGHDVGHGVKDEKHGYL